MVGDAEIAVGESDGKVRLERDDLGDGEAGRDNGGGVGRGRRGEGDAGRKRRATTLGKSSRADKERGDSAAIVMLNATGATRRATSDRKCMVEDAGDSCWEGKRRKRDCSAE